MSSSRTCCPPKQMPKSSITTQLFVHHKSRATPDHWKSHSPCGSRRRMVCFVMRHNGTMRISHGLLLFDRQDQSFPPVPQPGLSCSCVVSFSLFDCLPLPMRLSFFKQGRSAPLPQPTSIVVHYLAENFFHSLTDIVDFYVTNGQWR